MGVTHAFTSPKADGGDATLVQPSNWNAAHTLTGNISAFDGLANASGYLKNNGAGVFSYTTPTAGDVGGEPALGNPLVSGYVLSSTDAGVRSWIAPGGGGGTWTEVEIDFGSTPVYSKTFTVTDGTVSGTSKVAVVPCGKIATGGSEDDWEWDGISFAANPGAGSFRVMANASPGPVAGKRKISYQVA